MLAVIIPAAAGELVLARPLVALVLGHGAAASFNATGHTAQALAMLALGLPGFCVFLYAVRILQSVQDLRSAFWLYAFENGVNIVLAVLLAGHFGVRGIALSISVAYTVAAVVALAYVHTRFQGLGGDVLGRPLFHVALATVALALAAALASNVSGSETTPVALGRVVLGSVAGGGAYVLAAGGLAERAARKRRAAARTGRRGAAPLGPPSVRRAPTADRGRGGPGASHPRPRRRRPGAPPPRAAPLPPAGRPPTATGAPGADAPARSGRVAPRRRRAVADSLATAPSRGRTDGEHPGRHRQCL